MRIPAPIEDKEVWMPRLFLGEKYTQLGLPVIGFPNAYPSMIYQFDGTAIHSW